MLSKSNRFSRIFSACILVLAFVPLLAAEEDPDRLDPRVAPTSERVRLTIDADKTDYSGSVTIGLEVKETTDTFRFHGEKMTFDRMVLIGPDGEIGLSHEAGELGLVDVKVDTTLKPGEYTLVIDFHKPFSTKAVGLYRMEADGQGYLFTQFESEDAREAFPCWDEPGYKIPFQITLVIPEAHIAVTNTPLEKQTVKDGQRTIRFARTKPLPTYLIAMAAGPLETVDIPGMSVPGQILTVKGQSHLTGLAVEYTPKILAAMEKWFDSKYPFKKLDLIAVPEYWFGAMENPGAITFADGILLVDPKAPSTSQKRTLARVISHEVAHMWFGDVVTMEWWDDLWLNESFADWMGDKITQQVYPEFNLELSEMDSINGIMRTDARPSTRPIQRPVAGSDNKFAGVGTAYNKGKAILTMFENWIGEESFRKGVLAYIEANAWGNATSNDLWHSLAKTSNAELTSSMKTFLEQSGLPLLEVELKAGGQVKLTQKRFLNHGVEADDQTWKVPVTLSYPAGGVMQSKTFLLDQPQETVQLDTPESPVWVLPNGNAAGYYRWTVAKPMLMEMARTASKMLNPRERIGFIGNLGGLLSAGEIGGDIYLKGLSHFAQDAEPQVLAMVVDGLGGLKTAFVPAELEEPFANYVRQTLGPALDRFGMEKKPGEAEAVSLFRPQLLGYLGDEGKDMRVLEYAEKLAKSYMNDTGSIDASLASVALQLSAIHGDKELFDEYRKRFETAETPADRSRYLASLGSFRDPKIIDAALAYVMSGKVRPDEMNTITSPIGSTEGGRDVRWAYIKANYKAIVGRIPVEFAAFMPFYASGCSEARLGDAKEFFSQPENNTPGVDRSMMRMADSVNDCAALRKREGEAVSTYLKSPANGGVVAGGS